MVIGHVDSLVQCRTSKHIWLSLATNIVTWKFYLLFKFGQDCLVEVCISLFSYFQFVLIVWMCPTPYQMIWNTFNKRNPNIILIIQTGDLRYHAYGRWIFKKNVENLFLAVQIEKTEKNNLQKEWRKKLFTFYDKEKNYFWISWNLLRRVDSSN